MNDWVKRNASNLDPALGIIRTEKSNNDALVFKTCDTYASDDQLTLSVILSGLSLTWHGHPWKGKLYDPNICETLRRGILSKVAEQSLVTTKVNESSPAWEKNLELLYTNH